MNPFDKILKDWTIDQIIEQLSKENRIEDMELVRKFKDVGYRGMNGGNIQILDEPRTEMTMIGCIMREFGWLAPDTTYLTRHQFEKLCKWSKP